MKKTKPKPAGRPRELATPYQCTVRLDPHHVATAKRLGDGKIAVGVRAALEKAK